MVLRRQMRWVFFGRGTEGRGGKTASKLWSTPANFPRQPISKQSSMEDNLKKQMSWLKFGRASVDHLRAWRASLTESTVKVYRNKKMHSISVIKRKPVAVNLDKSKVTSVIRL